MSRNWGAVALFVGIIVLAITSFFLWGSDSLKMQTLEFFSLKHNAVIYALGGCILLAVNCGVLGCFVVVRRMALVGDTLSHAVLPGVALGFLFTLTKSPWVALLGAIIAGLVGIALVNGICQTTRIKEDSALGMVLTGFYAFGVCLFVWIQQLNVSEKIGLNSLLLGQASALSREDVFFLSGATLLSLTIFGVFYKTYLLSSFDREFARTLGMRLFLLDAVFMFLLGVSIVTALKAVGAVLVSAMLIIPPAAAFILTKRMHHMLLVSVLIGILSSISGACVSYLGPRLPTGPFIIMFAGVFFLIAFIISPKEGLLFRYITFRGRRRRIAAENTLKQIYKYFESLKSNHAWSADIKKLSDAWNLSEEELRSQLYLLKKNKWLFEDDQKINITERGQDRARQLIRNHRLWELYLTDAAHYAADHVHDNAEKIEHILGEEMVARLEKRLNYPDKDPHGQKIPSV